MDLNKKYFKPLAIIILIILIGFLIVFLSKPSTPKSLFLNTIPFLNKKSTAPSATENQFRSTGTPQQTNIQAISSGVDKSLSKIERDKVATVLPIRIEDFQTSTPLVTTINLYTLPSDPTESLRLEIYGINYNNSEIQGDDAIAFKDSFLQIKKLLLTRKINLHNVLFIYGNRQYIQDTATYWVNQFKLLD